MNRLFFVTAFALIAGLTSCNKELDQVPTPAKARAGAENAFPPVVISQKRYQLIKLGGTALTYDSFPFNRISQTTTSSGNMPFYEYYEYNDTPGNKSVKTTRYLSSRVVSTNVYQLDDNGLCFQADYWSFSYDPDGSQAQPDHVMVVHKQYEYLNGRLSYINTTAETASNGGSLKPFGEPRTDSFLYNTNGDLTILQSFVKQKKTGEVLYGYGSSVNQPDAKDKLPLNPMEVTENPYLPIFGPFSTNLVRLKRVVGYDGPVGGIVTTYDYVLNQEGYVVSRETKREWDKFRITQAYDYRVSTRPF